MPLPPAAGEAFRAAALRAAGATGPVVDELLAYGANAFAGHPGLSGDTLPLGDEAHVAAWEEYVAEAAREGAFATLARRLPQLRYPIRAGISEEPAYRQATRRGVVPWDAPGLALRDPAGVTLHLEPTPGGRIPVIVARERSDFVTLVQALTSRNEPAPVPDSMGACIVRGFNNWDRVARHRAGWEASLGRAADEAEWNAEFQRLVPQKERYQDRFILLSSGPYSALPARVARFPEADWARLSVVIRSAHEATHYFTFRVLDSMRNNAHDELLADCAGLLAATGRYDPRLALTFLGLERHPHYRPGGRLESYLGSPRLSDAAFAVLRELVHRAVRHLAAFLAAWPGLCRPSARGCLVLALAALSLEELADRQATHRLLATPALAPRCEQLRLRVPATDAGLRRAIDRFERFTASRPELARVARELAVCLDELISNAVKYGYSGRAPGSVTVWVARDPAELRVELGDDGDPFDPLAATAPDTRAALDDRPIGGLGVLIVRELMDDVGYRRARGRNRVRLTRRLG